jgi:hypothetical protein
VGNGKDRGGGELDGCIMHPVPTSINSRSASVCLSVRDAIVSRFNPPAEPARIVGFEKRDSARTVGFGNQAASA